jgi:type I restriction enzyme, S subunit
MKTKTIPSRWIKEEGLRLDSAPYMSGSIEAKKMLEELSIPKDQLQDVTEGGLSGIYHAGRIKRLWVKSAEYGCPFLSSTDILQADLSNVKYISKIAVEENPHLTLKEGYTLITRSGTVGKMAYARADMDGMACTEHVLRVIPDRSKILPGYLYAYLSSKFGVPMITSGTYGAIIQHIEPHHIAQLPIPRLSESIEKKAHNLVKEAADSRSLANDSIKTAKESIVAELDLPHPRSDQTSTNFSTFAAQSSSLSRLDAAHFSPVCVFSSQKLSSTKFPATRLGLIAEVFTPGIFKRQHVKEPRFGYAYFSGSELFQNEPEPRGYLSKIAPKIEDYIVHKNWLLLQDAGQLGGLIGRITRVNHSVDMGVVSNHLMRIKTETDYDAGYLFALLSSWYGYRVVTRHAFGTSIPQLDPLHISQIEIPWPDQQKRKEIASPVLKAWHLQDRAIDADAEAIFLVEKSIEEAV